jgi:hypothetical protein
MIFSTRIIDREYILSKYSEEDIFNLIGVRVTKGLFNNPFRKDSNPTCSFYVRNGRLLLNDFSGWCNGDCFEWVCKVHNLSFKQSLEFINSKMGGNSPIITKKHTLTEKVKSDLKVKWRSWKSSDLAYWKEFHISLETLNRYNVGCVDTVWINNNVAYRHSSSNPCYGYYFTKNDIKVYMPFSKKIRFMGNTQYLQGLNQLIERDILIITKSLKDVMVLHELGVSAIAPQAESVILDDNQYNQFNKFKLYSFYDFDLAGIRGANKMKRKYGIKPLFLTNGRFRTKNYQAKDIADLIKKDKQEAISFVQQLNDS